MPHRRIRRNISVVLVVQQQHIRGIRTPLHTKPRQSSSIKNNHTKNETGRNGTTADPTKPRQRPWHRDSRVPPIQPAVLYFNRGDFSPPPAGIKQGSRNANREDSASRQRKKRKTNILENNPNSTTEHDGGDRISDTAADVVPRTVHCDSLPISSHASSAGLVVSSLENDTISGRTDPSVLLIPRNYRP